MQITAKMVAELREKSGAGMMKCKQALVACDGDMEKAMDELRKSGLASAGKRAGRATSNGIVLPLISADKRHVGFVEVNCETDFVAKTDAFIAFANNLAKLVLDHPEVKSVADLEKLTFEGQTIDDYRKSIIAKTGENCSISRAEHLDIPEGTEGLFDRYVHNKIDGSEGGLLGVLVQLKVADAATAGKEEATKVAHQIALHIAMQDPIAVSEAEVSQEVKDREYKVGYEKAKIEQVEKAVNKALEKAGINPAHVDSEDHMKSNVGKGWITEEQVAQAKKIKTEVGEEAAKNLKDVMLQKIAEGRLAKFLKEGCLLDQTFLMDDTKTVKAYVDDASKELNSKLEVTTFRRWKCGEAAPKAEEAAE
ncbi:MAG: translation elongation factor Ts [Candidatus Riflebacteria bacterium]|nr:translation elongation factor Ts [Candidatus Riflebacteria bacterium]